jgi:methionyl-tRNA synthetase
MPEKIFIGIAWPYSSGPRHIGHAAGAQLPADIFARYHRMKGDEVLMVSGSDQHGTPTTLRAEQEGKTPAEVAERFHQLHSSNFEKLGISCDLYWKTSEQGHKKVVQDVFLKLYRDAKIFEKTMESPYCPKCGRFLPDRYVEGTCPNCRFDKARGDQCDNCGHILDPFDLEKPRCKICGTAPVKRETNHFFFRLSGFEQRLRDYLKDKSYWRQNVLAFTMGYMREGLLDRAVTRDIEWGVEIPLPGYETKRIYVWFEAVIGYLSTSIEWARRRGEPEKWKDWWYDPKAKHYYFVGKDNIPFHTIIWPSILMGYDEKLDLPYDVPADQFLNTGGAKMSSGRGVGVWLPELLERYDPDALRYYATATMPETRDADFTFEDLAAKNNSELLAVYGNFVHRALTFASKNFDGAVPAAGFLDGADKAMIRNIEEQWKKVGQNLDFVHFKDALREAIQLARLGNQYFDQKAPWDLVRKDKAACGTAIHVAVRTSRALAVIMAPFLPFSSQRLWTMLGHDSNASQQSWAEALEDMPAGQKLRVGKPLFSKIEEVQATSGGEVDLFDIRVGQIIEVKDHPRGDKLYVLQVDLGDEKRQLVAGIRQNYKKEEIAGKRIAVLCNLQPAKLRGIESNGMLLAAEGLSDVAILIPPGDVPLGSQLLGKKGASMMGFEDFQKFKFAVGEEHKAYFLGSAGKLKVALMAGGKHVIADKDMKEGAAVR